jgi:hypothetical protein
MAVNDAPTQERGVVSNQPPPVGPNNLLGFAWGTIADEQERAPKLKWPQSIPIFEAMLNDAQIRALQQAITLPIMRRKFTLAPNGADDRIVQHVASDLGLAVQGEDDKPTVVSPNRFSFKRHLRHVLLAPFYGHYYFSQWAPIGDDGLAHLRKLLPLPPRTISEIRVNPDGGLDWVRQWVGRNVRDLGRPDPLPVSILTCYVWEQEAGNWHGRSMLRSIYREWLAKDDAMRMNAGMLRRNGMGIPTARQTEKDADGSQLAATQKIAAAWRAGEEASAGLPYGYDIEIKGVQGTLPDAIPTIKAYDEAMARSFLAMFMQLGQTNHGARALGTTFVDVFNLALDAIADELVCDVTTQHVIRDIVDWNYGPDVELVPLLVSERDEDPELSVSDLTALVAQGVLTVDDQLEQVIRGRYGLPELIGHHHDSSVGSQQQGGPAQPPQPPAPAASGRGRPRGPFRQGR